MRPPATAATRACVRECALLPRRRGALGRGEARGDHRGEDVPQSVARKKHLVARLNPARAHLATTRQGGGAQRGAAHFGCW